MDSEKEALMRHAKDTVEKLRLQTAMQIPQAAEEAQDRRIAERLKRHMEAQDRQLKLLETAYSRYTEALNRQINALNRQATELNDQEAQLIRRTEELTRQIVERLTKTLIRRETELKNREEELNQRTEEIKSREAALQKAPSLESSVVKNIAAAGVGDFQTVAASQLELGLQYYKKVLEQANYSFWWALFAAVVGLFFFLVASGLILRESGILSNASLISGVVVEIISGIGFTLYAHASRQLASFHVRLDKTLHFLFANSVCEHIKNDAQLRETTRSQLVLSMANSQQPAAKKKLTKGIDKIVNKSSA